MAFVIQVVITFFLTPFVLREIGDMRYGVWAVVLSITGYYGLLDLGLRAGMTQYITRYYSMGDYARMNMAASSGFVLHLGCAIVVLLATIVTVIVAPVWFTVDSDLMSEAIACVWILGCSTALQLVLFPFSVALTTKQRFDLITAVSLFCRLLSAAATVVALHAGYGLTGVCAAGALGSVLDYIIRCGLARWILPELKIAIRQANRSSCRECIGFGFWSSLLAASHLIIGLSDALVIGLFMPASAIAFFALANNLIRYFANIFVPVSQVFYPAATDLDARNDLVGLQTLYLTGSRLITLVAISAAMIAGLWADDFYALWVGTRYVQTDTFHSVPLLFQVLLAGALFTAATGIGSKVLLGRRKLRNLTWLFAVEGSMNLAISVVLIQSLGLLGVALGTALPAVVCRGIVHPILVCSNLQLGLKQYSREIVWPTVVVSVLLAPLVGVVHHVTPSQTWAELVLGGIAAIVLAAAVISVFGFTASDRHGYLYPMVRRVMKIPGVLQLKH